MIPEIMENYNDNEQFCIKMSKMYFEFTTFF
jgi:hypothetical protein